MKLQLADARMQPLTKTFELVLALSAQMSGYLDGDGDQFLQMCSCWLLKLCPFGQFKGAGTTRFCTKQHCAGLGPDTECNRKAS